MAVILTVERKTAKARMFLALIYAVLSLGGVTMVWPFLVMFASSLTGPYDYYRFSPVVYALWERPDRFMRYVASCYPRFPAEVFPDAPAHWGSWLTVSRDRAGGRRFARAQLAGLDDPRTAARWRRMAADYADFNSGYDLRNSVCNFDPRDVAGFVRAHFEAAARAADPQAFDALPASARRQAALDRLNAEWPVRYTSFFGIRMVAQQRAPLHHAGWDYPADDPKMELYQEFKRFYRDRAGGGRASAETPADAATRRHADTSQVVSALPAHPPVLVSSPPKKPSGCGQGGLGLFSRYSGGGPSPRKGPSDAATRRHADTGNSSFLLPPSSFPLMTRTVPYESRPLWLAHLRRPDAQARLGLPRGRPFAPSDYARLAGHPCSSFENLPFPLPPDAPPALRGEWERFVRNAYPRRLLRIRVTPALERAYQDFARDTCKTFAAYERLTGAGSPDTQRPTANAQRSTANDTTTPRHADTGNSSLRPPPSELSTNSSFLLPPSSFSSPAPNSSFLLPPSSFSSPAPNSSFLLPPSSFSSLRLPAYENSTLWRNFIPSVPLENLEVLSAEQAWQAYLLGAYGSAAAVNAAYGWSLASLAEARFPLREAMAVTFAQRGWRDFFAGMAVNYRTVGEFLFLRGQAFGNTLLLVALSVLATLTVNPLAAYALSRFGLRSAEKLLLFLLATMAFPAAVTAIPGFLLIRDLGLLNTFAALVLPTLASGMSIFILKGFFDGLPRELYEAAAIDGAKEWQIFLKITLPMTTPILAVNALNAFVSAYNSWEWALLVCQRQSRWTLAVWMYQMSQQLADQPWAVMAGFVLVSIPTAVVFIACQQVILRGIVLPSMK